MRTRRKGVVRLAAAVTGMLAVLVFASPAVAHARLLGSTPRDRGTVTEPITEIRLHFSGPVKQSLTTVRVTGPDGAAYGNGEPVAVDATVTQAVAAMPAGETKVGWRTVSVDGHTIQGSFTFTNRAAAAVPATAATITTSPPGGFGWIVGAVSVAALAAAAVAARWWRRRQAPRG